MAFCGGFNDFGNRRGDGAFDFLDSGGLDFLLGAASDVGLDFQSVVFCGSGIGIWNFIGCLWLYLPTSDSRSSGWETIALGAGAFCKVLTDVMYCVEKVTLHRSIAIIVGCVQIS